MSLLCLRCKDLPPAECLQQEEFVCAGDAAQSGMCDVPSGGKPEEEGGGFD